MELTGTDTESLLETAIALQLSIIVAQQRKILSGETRCGNGELLQAIAGFSSLVGCLTEEYVVCSDAED